MQNILDSLRAAILRIDMQERMLFNRRVSERYDWTQLWIRAMEVSLVHDGWHLH